MEQIYSGLKQFVLSAPFECRLAELSDEDTPLSAPKEKDVVFGVADLSRYENPLLCVITPDAEEETDGAIGSVTMQTRVTVSFLCRGAQYPVLMRKMCRYAAAFRRAVQNDSTLAGLFEGAAFIKADFFPDAGTIEKQMTACEIELEITHTEHITADTDNTEDW